MRAITLNQLPALLAALTIAAFAIGVLPLPVDAHPSTL